jgi:hypothetical protein
MTGTAKAPPSWLIEGIGRVPPPHPGMLLDLEMLVHAEGQERIVAAYRNLLSLTGFRLIRVLTTAGPMSIVEAIPA